MITFDNFASKLESLENISSRNELAVQLCELFKTLGENEIAKAIYLLQERVAPKYEPIEFNFGARQMEKVLSELFEIPIPEIKKLSEKYGDFGPVVYELKSNQKPIDPKKLELDRIGKGFDFNYIFELLLNFANTTGKDSVKQKIEAMKTILSDVDKVSGKFIVKIVLGSLRLGLHDKTIISALALLLSDDKKYSDMIEHAFGVQCDLGEIGRIVYSLYVGAGLVSAQTYSIAIEKVSGGYPSRSNREAPLQTDSIALKLNSIKCTPGIPIASKLVEREKNISAILKRMSTCLVQPKFDGLRCQIHCYFDGDEPTVKLFSRNLESLTESFPDIIEATKKLLKKKKLKSMILDSEVIGVDQSGKYLQFSDTIQRKRKHDVEGFSEKIQIEVQVFDILYFEGDDLTMTETQSRVKIVNDLLTDHEGILKPSLTLTISDEEEFQETFDKFVNDQGLEGIIAKLPSSHYDPGTRNFDWIKLKRSSDSLLNDTVDAVVMGYYFGRGDRTVLGIGGILVGLYDKKFDKYLSLCKVGTGFTEEDFKKYKLDLDKYKLESAEAIQHYSEVDKLLVPDVWVEPKIVVEIEADEITVSKKHKAGYSLRFPRIKKWGRDKNPEQSTTISELKSMFELRFGKK